MAVWIEWMDRGQVRREPVVGRISVGRAPGNTVTIHDERLSRQHCVIGPSAQGVVVDASRSQNGVIVGGRRSRRADIPAGGVFQLGGTVFRVVASAPAAAPQAPLIEPLRSRGAGPPRATVLAGGLAVAAVVLVGVLVVTMILRGGDSETETLTELVRVRVNASEGGTASAPGGPSVSIPADALDQDASVSISRRVMTDDSPILGRSAGDIYDISVGPAKLNAPATVRFPAANVAQSLSDPERNVYVAHFDENLGIWVPLPSAVDATGAFVQAETSSFSPFRLVDGFKMKLPYEDGTSDARFTGGPHQWGRAPYCAAGVDAASGIDFGGGGWRVLSVAAGTLVATGRKEDTGNFVIIRHEGGIQSEYWHLASLFPASEAIQRAALPKVGDYLPAGYPIGIAGSDGYGAGKDPHLHLELSIGRASPGVAGAVSWHGQMIDGWKIFEHLIPGSSGLGYSYQGSAVRGLSKLHPITLKVEKIVGCGKLDGHPAVASTGGAFAKEVEEQPLDGCAADKARDCTVFAYEGLPGLQLYSTNKEYKGGVPADPPPSPAVSPARSPSPGNPPGGVWLQAPKNGEVISSSTVPLRAEGRPGSSPLQRVEFTAWWPAWGPEGGPWFLICEEEHPISGAAYSCEFDLSRVPPGPFKVSFDVYDNGGRHTLSPNGKREAIRSGPTPPADFTPPTNLPPPTPTPTPTRTPTPTPTRSPTPTPTRTPTPTPTRTPTPTPTPGPQAAPVIYSLGCPSEVLANEQVVCDSDGDGTVTSLTWSAPGGNPSGGTGGIVFITRYASPGQQTISLTACNGSACTTKSQVITIFGTIGGGQFTFTGDINDVGDGGTVDWESAGDVLRLCYHLTPENIPYTVALAFGGGTTSFDDNGIDGGGCVDVSSFVSRAFPPGKCFERLTVSAVRQGAALRQLTFFVNRYFGC